MSIERTRITTDNPDVVLEKLQPLAFEDTFEVWQSAKKSADSLYESQVVSDSLYDELTDEDAPLTAGYARILGKLITDDNHPAVDMFAIRDQEGQRFTGTINTVDTEDGIELGYWLDDRYTGNGYMGTAIRAMVRSLDSSGKRIFAEVDSDNKKSQKVLERVGFKKTDKHKEGGRLVFEHVRSPED